MRALFVIFALLWLSPALAWTHGSGVGGGGGGGGLAAIAPSAGWTQTALSGAAPPALNTAIQGQKTVCGSHSGSGGFVVLTLCTSTASIASGDEWTVGSQAGTIPGATDVGGTVEANGTWQVAVLTSTDVMLCSQMSVYTGCVNGPTWAHAWTSGGTIGVNAPVIAWFDEVPGQLITADNQEHVGIASATANRGWIDQVKCYLEGTEVDQTIDKQMVNPDYGTHGIVFTVNNRTVSPLSGVAEMVCDVYPTNGLVRRIATQFWFNYAGTSGYIDRTNALHVKYVDAAATPDTNSSNDCAHTNHTGAIGDPYQTMAYGAYCAGIGGVVYAKGTLTEPLTTHFTSSDKVLANFGQRVDVYPWPTFSYTLGTVTRGAWYPSAVAVDFHNATWDMGSIQSVQGGCTPGSCAANQETTYGAWQAFTLCQNCTQIDGVAGLGPTYGYYIGSNLTQTANYYAVGTRYYGLTETTYQMHQTQGLNFRRNNSGTNAGDEGEFDGWSAGYIANTAMPQAAFNESASAPVDGSNHYLLAYNRLTRLPAPETVTTLTPGVNVSCTYPAVPINSESNAANLPVITNVTYTAPNTIIEFDDCQSVANNGGTLTVIIPDSAVGGTQLVNYNASGGSCAGAGGACWIAGTQTPYVRPVIQVPGVNWLASGAAAIGNHIFVTAYQHGDNFKFNVGAQSYGVWDYNLMFQNYRANSANQSFFTQTGGAKEVVTIQEDATLSDCPGAVAPGTCIVESAAPASNVQPYAGGFAWICAWQGCPNVAGTAQANARQYRKIVQIVDTTHFILDRAFGPSFGATATSWDYMPSAANIACVGCRDGGTNIGTNGAGGDQAQFQAGTSNWAIVQLSLDWNHLSFRGMQTGQTGSFQSGGVSMDYQAFYDSILGWDHAGYAAGTCSDNSIEFNQTTGCPSPVLQSYIEGVVFDNMTYLNPNTTYGTGIATQSKTHLNDADYKIGSSGVTQTLRGTWGNGHLADGTPLYPWAPDGTAHSTLVGAW